MVVVFGDPGELGFPVIDLVFKRFHGSSTGIAGTDNNDVG